MSNLLKLTHGLRSFPRVGVLALASLLCVARVPLAHADTMLLATTDLVAGTSADTFSFDAPSAGSVTAELTSVPWPVPLGALNFSATNASNVLASWSGSPSTMSTPFVDTFQVGSGTYFAHVTATAAGSLDLGLYSLMLSFKPAAVPLPASDWTLLLGALALFGLARVVSTLTPFGTFKTLGEPVELH